MIVGDMDSRSVGVNTTGVFKGKSCTRSLELTSPKQQEGAASF